MLQGKKWLVRGFFAVCLLACVGSAINARTVAEPWPHEGRRYVIGALFLAAVWGGTEVVAKRQGRW